MRQALIVTLFSVAAWCAGRMLPVQVHLPAALLLHVRPHALGGFTVECDSCTETEVQACVNAIASLPAPSSSW